MGSDDIRPLDAWDRRTADAAAALLNRELGEGQYRPEWLQEDAASPAAGVWVAGAPALAGAAVARVMAAADGDYYRAFGATALDLFAGTVGSFEAFAVEPDHRRRGLGSGLATTALDWMSGHGCSSAVTIAWRSGRPGSSVGLFRRLGLTEGPTVGRFYLEESVRDGWSCPVCGGPCTCAATLFWMPFTR